MDAIRSEEIIERILGEKASELGRYLSSEIIFVQGQMFPGMDDDIRQEIENLAGLDGCKEKLSVVLETSGGAIEVVERISSVLRHHFDTVDFIIPNFAYSAGTVLALSGDEIYMDYYSVLGPIDPQIINKEGRWVPGAGYLEAYNELTERSQLTPGEAIMMSQFDSAELFALQQALDHSSDLIENWLVKFKFKNWDTRETSGKEATKAYKKKRAKEIAKELGDAKRWKLHGRGIPLSVLQEEIGLKITDFGEDAELEKKIREYYSLFVDFCSGIGSEVNIHTRKRLVILGEDG